MLSLPVTPTHHAGKFASPEFPLRASKIDDFMRCTGSVALSWLPEKVVNDLGGEAAQTGNIVHAAVSEYHKNGNSKESGDVGLLVATTKFPDGKKDKAQKIFDAYVADDKNKVTLFACEEEVQLIVEGNIAFNGTTDQIRDDGSQLSIWDVKTGSRLSAAEYLAHHRYQLSIYAVAATQKYGRQVKPGGLICTNGYTTRERVHIFASWNYDQALRDVRAVARRVLEVREGIIAIAPTAENCKYCPYKSINTCLPKYKELINAGQ